MRGQALVLVALMLIVIFGFVGLAVDGGRLYWERRILQNAVDAGALAASDNYQGSNNLSTSLHAAATEYAANERLYGTATANPSWTATTTDVSWTGSTDVMHVVFTSAGSVSAFDVSSSHRIGLAFMQVLGAGSTATVKSIAEGHAKTGGVNGTTLVTLSQGTCNGGTGSLTVSGATAGLLIPAGNVQSNGSVTAGGVGISVTNGKFSDNCTNPVPSGVTASGGTFAGVAPVADPGFSSGPLNVDTGAQSAGSNVVILPGIYAANPAVGACYFMTAGVYQFNGGISNSSSMLSNELHSPDEAAWGSGAPNYNNTVASPQYWGTCAGSFTVASPATALGVSVGNWGVVVTSTRSEVYPAGGTTYVRESAPSTCHPVTVGTNSGIQVTINNVPGATGYNIYLAFATSGSACATGPWGFVGKVVNSATEVQGNLGTTISPLFDSSTITTLLLPAAVTAACTPGTTYAFGCAAATGAFGAANPPGDGAETAPQYTGGPPFLPARDTMANGGGDRANERNCMPRGTTSGAPCAGATVTPGAVQAYFPAGACISSTGGNLSWFSGFQYNYIAVYAPPANTCSVNFAGRARFGTGAVYWPAGNWFVAGNGKEPVASQMVVYTFTAQGNGTTTIIYDPQSAPSQGYSQISL
ncbi:MAG: hypothetical protein NVS9B1_22870 [Candidatus Dormibacteraceae bacterium]